MRKQAMNRVRDRAVGRPLLAFALAAAAFAVPAHACVTFDDLPDTKDTVNHLPNCAIFYTKKQEMGGEGLEAAMDLGGGFVRQRYTAVGCGAAYMSLLTDCRSGQALAVGYGVWESESELGANHSSSIDEKLEVFEASQDKRIKKGAPDSILAELQRAAAKRFDLSQIVEIRHDLRLSVFDNKPAYSYNLRCGCELFYPGSPGAQR